MGRGLGRGRGLGSATLLLIGALVLMRPWELRPASSAAPAASARVIRAVDGDTIEARIGDAVEDVRYIGVDTPETVKPGTPVQCFGHRASAFNSELVEGRRLRLVFGAERRDVYGRLLAYAYIGHRMVNAELVRRGLARTLEIAPNTQHSALFARLQQDAAAAGRGLWGGCRP